MSSQARRRAAVTVSSAALCLIAVVGFVVRTTPSAAAESATVVANWQMNEGKNASKMNDSSGNNIDGLIGDAVETGASYKGDTGYRWDSVSPTQPPAKPERIVHVPDNDNLEPEDVGDSDLFVIEFRYRTRRSFGNVVQKGQNSGPGGYWKFEQPNGFMTCLFQGPPMGGVQVQQAVKSSISTRDGEWHTIRCELDRDNPNFEHGAIRLYVDGELNRVAAIKKPFGDINNNAPLTIGGKLNCDQINTTCDYFEGDIDYVKIEKSGGVTPTTPAPTTTTVPPGSTTTTPPGVTTTSVAPPPPTTGRIDAATVDATAERGAASPLP